MLRLVAVGAVVLAAVVLAPSLAKLPALLRHAAAGWLAAGAAAEVLSALSYVVAFRAIFSAPISWSRTYEIAMAGQAANSALPANGVGGLAFSAWALRRTGMTLEAIARKSVAFFMLTSLANVLMLLLFGGLLTLHVAGRDDAPSLTLGFIGAALAVTAAAIAFPWVEARFAGVRGESLSGSHGRVRAVIGRAVAALAGGITESIELLRRRPLGVIAGTAAYLAFDIAALGASFRAFGHAPPPAVLLVAYLIGQMGGALPIPGGFGALEGGLIGAFAVYGTPLPETTAAVLAYRAFSMWVPVLLGGHALVRLRKGLRAQQNEELVTAAGQPARPVIVEPVSPGRS